MSYRYRGTYVDLGPLSVNCYRCFFKRFFFIWENLFSTRVILHLHSSIRGRWSRHVDLKRVDSSGTWVCEPQTVKHSCIVAVMHCTVMSVYLWTNDFSDWYVVLYYVPKCAYFIMTIDWISSMCPLYIFFYETVKFHYDFSRWPFSMVACSENSNEQTF